MRPTAKYKQSVSALNNYQNRLKEKTDKGKKLDQLHNQRLVIHTFIDVIQSIHQVFVFCVTFKIYSRCNLTHVIWLFNCMLMKLCHYRTLKPWGGTLSVKWLHSLQRPLLCDRPLKHMWSTVLLIVCKQQQLKQTDKHVEPKRTDAKFTYPTWRYIPFTDTKHPIILGSMSI